MLSIRSSSIATTSSDQMRWYKWFMEPQFYLVACIHIVTKLFSGISQAYIVFYVQYTVELPAKYVAISPLVIYVAGFLISTITKQVTGRIGLKFTFIASCQLGIGNLSCTIYKRYKQLN